MADGFYIMAGIISLGGVNGITLLQPLRYRTVQFQNAIENVKFLSKLLDTRFGGKRFCAQIIDRGTNFSLSSSELFLPQVSRVALHDEREAKEKGEVPNNE